LAVLDELPNHWLFGKGAGATIAVYRFGDANVKEGIVDWWFIHNNYAQVLHKSGVIGLLCLLALWLGALSVAFRLFQTRHFCCGKAGVAFSNGRANCIHGHFTYLACDDLPQHQFC
jgi:hypothetical protein